MVMKTLRRSKIEMEAGVGNGNPLSHALSEGGVCHQSRVSNERRSVVMKNPPPLENQDGGWWWN